MRAGILAGIAGRSRWTGVWSAATTHRVRKGKRWTGGQSLCRWNSLDYKPLQGVRPFMRETKRRCCCLWCGICATLWFELRGRRNMWGTICPSLAFCCWRLGSDRKVLVAQNPTKDKTARGANQGNIHEFWISLAAICKFHDPASA